MAERLGKLVEMETHAFGAGEYIPLRGEGGKFISGDSIIIMGTRPWAVGVENLKLPWLYSFWFDGQLLSLPIPQPESNHYDIYYVSLKGNRVSQDLALATILFRNRWHGAVALKNIGYRNTITISGPDDQTSLHLRPNETLLRGNSFEEMFGMRVELGDGTVLWADSGPNKERSQGLVGFYVGEGRVKRQSREPSYWECEQRLTKTELRQLYKWVGLDGVGDEKVVKPWQQLVRRIDQSYSLVDRISGETRVYMAQMEVLYRALKRHAPHLIEVLGKVAGVQADDVVVAYGVQSVGREQPYLVLMFMGQREAEVWRQWCTIRPQTIYDVVDSLQVTVPSEKLVMRAAAIKMTDRLLFQDTKQWGLEWSEEQSRPFPELFGATVWEDVS